MPDSAMVEVQKRRAKKSSEAKLQTSTKDNSRYVGGGRRRGWRQQDGWSRKADLIPS